MPEPTRRNFGIRLPIELIEAIEARATGSGQTKTQITEAALCAYLGLEVGTDAPDVMQRLANVEQRLTDVEQRLTLSAQRRPTPPYTTPQTAPNTGEYRGEGEGQHPKADGVTWLTAKQAWEYCRGQGWVSPRGSTTQTAFVQWAGRNPADLLEQYGLEATGHTGSGNTTASYRKVRGWTF